jgi:hypothetical protein
MASNMSGSKYTLHSATIPNTFLNKCNTNSSKNHSICKLLVTDLLTKHIKGKKGKTVPVPKHHTMKTYCKVEL